MKTAEIEAQYANGLSRYNIERALVAAGKDPSHLQPADLGALEDFHTLGRIATSQLAELAEITRRDEVLDWVLVSAERPASSPSSTDVESSPSTSSRSTATRPAGSIDS